MLTETLQYPPAPPGGVVDTCHGVRVPDPYRWLEDADHPATVAWVAAQNALTESVLRGPAPSRVSCSIPTSAPARRERAGQADIFAFLFRCLSIEEGSRP
jgi:hypothetical protein